MKAVTLSWGQLVPAPCPVCQRTLKSATGISNHGSIRPAAGDRTLCDQCLTWLVFESNPFHAGLRLRRATPEEIAEIEPEGRALAEFLGAAIADDETKQ